MHQNIEGMYERTANGVWHQVRITVRLNGPNANSDIDLFVETQTPNPFKLMDAKDFLEQKTGTPVDIVRNHQHLNPRLRKRIEKDAVIIF